MPFIRTIACGLTLFALSVNFAHADKRVALVIGNSAYQHASELPNPGNDSADMVKALRQVGFQVIDGLNLDKTTFERKLRDFAAALQGADVGLFFYAGHGLQVAGQNYLIPIDAELETATSLDFETVRLEVVQRVMESAATTNILFLDACRNNPFARNLARALGTRAASIGRGLAPVEAGSGTLISFSTQPGNVALDGGGRNSPFAGSLVKHIGEANEDLSGLLIAVRNEVVRETNRQQVPWEHSALTARFYFKAVTNTASPSALSPAAQQTSEAERSWQLVRESNDVAILEQFVTTYRNTFVAALARARLEELKKSQVAPPLSKPTVALVTPPAPPVASSNPCGTGAVAAAFSSLRPPCPLFPVEERSLKPKDSFKECDKCPEMVVVPAGRFAMGSPANEAGRDPNEGPQHQVTIAKPFAVGKFHVTVDQFAAFVAATSYDAGSTCVAYKDDKWEEQGGRSWRNPGFAQAGNHPAACLNWNDAKAYVAWLSRETGRSYRLLTEAEWESAARASSTGRYSFGDKEADVCRYGNGADQTAKSRVPGAQSWAVAPCDDGYAYTSPVGAFSANRFGLHDMQGNAWQWVEDCWHDSYSGSSTDGSAWTSGECSRRVVRGGSWFAFPRRLRASYRNGQSSDIRYFDIGFRVGRTLAPPL